MSATSRDRGALKYKTGKQCDRCPCREVKDTVCVSVWTKSTTFCGWVDPESPTYKPGNEPMIVSMSQRSVIATIDDEGPTLKPRPYSDPEDPRKRGRPSPEDPKEPHDPPEPKEPPTPQAKPGFANHGSQSGDG